MIGPTDPRSARRLRRWRFALLALAGLLLGHTAVYVVAYGDGGRLAQAMSSGGHDDYWTVFAGLALAGLVVLGVDGLLSLRRAVRSARPGEGPGSRAGSGPDGAVAAGERPATRASDYLTELLDLWGPLFVVVCLAFLLQENIESTVMWGHAPLLGVYTEHLLAAPLLALVTAILAAVGALVRWEIAALTRRVSPAARPWGRPSAHRPDRRWSIAGLLRPARWALLRADIGRAPPELRAIPA